MFPILLAATSAFNLAQTPLECPKIVQRTDAPTRARPHTLDKEPVAEGYYTVLRTDQRGCVIPVKLKEAPKR
jgi:hypothetical protein